MKIEVAGRIRYPDAFVYRTPVPSNETVIREPVVVFEVLSPGTSRTDRIEKLREYQATEFIQRYVILEQDSIAATVFTRQGTDWIAHALTSRDTLRMPEIAVELPLSDIFADAGLSDEDAAGPARGSAVRELIARDDAEQGPAMSDHTIKSILWWICLVAAPAVLIGIELFHPAGFTTNPGMYQFLSEPHAYHAHFDALDYFGPSWWFALHMIQTPLVGLVAVGLWLLVEPINRAAGTLPMILAWLSRAATLIFVIYYTALDATGGIGLGRTIVIAQELASSGQLDAQQLKGVILLLNTMWTDPWVGGVGSFISETGSWAAFAAPLFAALAWVLWRPRILAAADRPGRVRVGTPDQPRQPTWSDRLRTADRRLGLAVVQTSQPGSRGTRLKGWRSGARPDWNAENIFVNTLGNQRSSEPGHSGPGECQ